MKRMKRNTGCGCNNGHSCPPAEACDKAKTKRVDCDFDSFKPKGKKLNVPVLDALVPLAEVEVEADVEAEITLPDAAREIKSIKKNLKLIQCRAVPSSKGPWFAKLYITGIVHKNIQYVDACDGFVKDFSTDVHFTCIHKVKLFNPIRDPFGFKGVGFSSKSSDVYEYRELDDKGHGANRCVTGSKTFEVFNEPIECKLLGSHIREIDLLNNFNEFGLFDEITEKMEVRFWVKLSQMQQVKFDPTPDHHYPSYAEADGEEEGYEEGYEEIAEESIGDRFRNFVQG